MVWYSLRQAALRRVLAVYLRGAGICGPVRVHASAT